MSYSHGGSYRIVGITSRSSARDLQWLMDFIKNTFWDHVSDVRYLPISNTNRIEWERNVRACSHGILYHSKRQGRINITDVKGALYDEELHLLSTALGRSNVLVVLDDLENCSDVEKQRILESQPSLQTLSSDLLLFPEEAKDEEVTKKKAEFIKLLGIKSSARDPPPNTTKAKDTSSSYIPGFFDKISKTFSGYKTKLPSIDIAPVPPQSRLKIGIFSRSAESNYGWLVEWLKTTYLTRPVDVQAVYISNTTSHFYTELSHCSFAILYHTKKQGRINITDVTDNLYDDELQELSKSLGKENVIVVIDDLQKTDASEKARILRNQPSIGRLARGMFLFNEKKKSSEQLEEIEQILRKKIPRNEVRRDDYRQDNAGRKYNASGTHPRFPDLVHSQDSSVDMRSPSTESRGQPDKSTAHDPSRKGADDPGGPEAKRRNVDAIGSSFQASAEVESAFQQTYAANNEVYRKWLECRQIQQKESRDMMEQIERLQRENEELQHKYSDLDMKMRESKESYSKTLEEKDRTIDQLRQDLRNKDRIPAENQDPVWKMEYTNLDKKMRENEELQKQMLESYSKTLEEKERTIDQLRQDLCHKDKTIEKDKETIRKMEDKMQQLLSTDRGMETNPRQEQTEQNRKQEMQSHETQRYNVRSLLSGQEADKMSQDLEKAERKGEGSPRNRTRRNTTTLDDPRQKPTETQSLREAEEQIEELRRTIQQKEEENQKMRVQLKESETLIQDLLMHQSGEKKTKS